MAVYTIEDHVERLEILLSDCGGRICNFCPATDYFDSSEDPEEIWEVENSLDPNHPCIICQQFIGLEPKLHGVRCPCLRLGGEAIPETREAIQAYYQEAMK